MSLLRAETHPLVFNRCPIQCHLSRRFGVGKRPLNGAGSTRLTMIVGTVRSLIPHSGVECKGRAPPMRSASPNLMSLEELEKPCRNKGRARKAPTGDAIRRDHNIKCSVSSCFRPAETGEKGAPSSPRLDAARNIFQLGPLEGFVDRF